MLSVPPPPYLLFSIPPIQAEGQLWTLKPWERSDAEQKAEAGKAFSLLFSQNPRSLREN